LAAVSRLRKLGPSTLVLGAGALGTFLIQALALRLMSLDDVGLLVLCLGIVSVASTIATLGTAQLVPRLVAMDASVLLVRRPLLKYIASVGTVVAAASIALSLLVFPDVRRLSIIGALLLVAVVATRALQFLEAAFRRGHGALASGAVVQQSAALFTAAAMAILLCFNVNVTPTNILGLFLVSQAILLMWSIKTWWPKRESPGVREWVRAHSTQLVVFWWTAVLAMGFLWADRLVVGGLLSLSDLAAYQSIVLMTTLFDVLALGVGYVHMPRYAAAGHRSEHDGHFLVALSAMGVVVTLGFAFLIGGRLFLVRWSAEHIEVLLALTAAGIGKLVYADLSSAIGGLAQIPALWRFARHMTITLISGIVVTAGLTVTFGLFGAAIGGLIIWATRVTICHFDARQLA
jgi:O-antigen/teichoic acid export membrane protein